MFALLQLIVTVIDLYVWVIIIAAVMSWLVAFNVINRHNQVVAMIGDIVYRLTEPALAQIRRFMPNLGGIDISPVILILLLYFVRNLLIEYWPR